METPSPGEEEGEEDLAGAPQEGEALDGEEEEVAGERTPDRENAQTAKTD